MSSGDSGASAVDSANVRRIRFPYKYNVLVERVCISEKHTFRQNDSILRFRIRSDEGQLTDRKFDLRFPTKGIVTELFVKRGDQIGYRSPVLTFEHCTHSLLLSNICARCGELVDDEMAGDARPERVSMIHDLPALRLLRTEALEISRNEMFELESKRRLVLAVDLDQTIVDSTCDPRPSELDPQVYRYDLAGNGVIYYSRFRDGIHGFLERINRLYKMDVFTFGQRSYAQRIISFIDPQQSLFGGRIVTRDECMAVNDKTANLRSIFPSGDHMVVIIDDRSDVWNHAQNQVVVHSFNHFRANKISQFGAYAHFRNEFAENADDDDDEQIVRSTLDCVVDAVNVAESDGWRHRNYLEDLERILVLIHQKYYEKNPTVSAEEIMREERAKILDGVVIMFSGVVKKNANGGIERSFAYYYARQLGADVVDDFDEPQTITHCVCTRRNTRKVRDLVRNARDGDSVFFVSPDWLWDCYVSWKRMPEEDYKFTGRGFICEWSCPMLVDNRGGSISSSGESESEEIEVVKRKISDDFSDSEHEEPNAKKMH